MNKYGLFFASFAFATLHASLVSGADFLPETGDPVEQEVIDALRDPGDALATGADNETVVIDDMKFDVGTLLTQGFSGSKWTDGKLVYAFDQNVSSANRQKFINACEVWEDVSAVECVERTNQSNYVHVMSSSSNQSYVGMIGGRQTLEIYNWDWHFIIAHEIGHALGLSHEHSRSDRDTYVEILEDNIRPEYLFAFDKRATTNFTPYDFRSIMHYHPNSFSLNGGPSIQPRPGYETEGQHMGNRAYLSSQDAAGMSSRYGAN